MSLDATIPGLVFNGRQINMEVGVGNLADPSIKVYDPNGDLFARPGIYVP